ATASGGTGEQMIDSIKLLYTNNWKVIRTMPLLPQPAASSNIFEPRESIPYTAKWLVKAREELGSDLTLGLDYHHRLSPAETASFCQRMPVGTLDFIEEPIRDESPEAYEALRKQTPISFAVGE